MGSLARFLRRPSAEQRVLVAAAVWLAAIRVGLWVLPFRSVLRATHAAGGRGRRRGPPLAVERIVWAVGAADRLVPRSTCLVRALAAQVLLARQGYPSALRLGVAGGAGRTFEAHAWLEHDGQILIGRPEDDRYTPLPRLDTVR